MGLNEQSRRHWYFNKITKQKVLGVKCPIWKWRLQRLNWFQLWGRHARSRKLEERGHDYKSQRVNQVANYNGSDQTRKRDAWAIDVAWTEQKKKSWLRSILSIVVARQKTKSRQ